MRYLIGRVHEVALKRGNRWRFVKALRDHMRQTFSDYPLGQIRSEGPRLIAELPDALPDEVVIERAARVFGLQNFTLSHAVAPRIEAIREAVVASVLGRRARDFAVRARRADKGFPLNSMELEREIGGAVKVALDCPVNLDAPELLITVEILPNAAYFSIGKLAGAGGLPVGSSGSGLALLSGGIDSPVAAWRMMRRGLRLDFVHFHSYPLLSRTGQEKAAELAARLTTYQGRAALLSVPFAETQRAIVAGVARPLRVVLYRRFMMRIACALAARQRAQALVTGESLGQVASQTLGNISVIEQAATLPVLRPLVGMDKNEIVEQARRLNTFDISIVPDEDCCTLFVPRHPETWAHPEAVAAAEAALDIATLVNGAVAATERANFTFPPLAAGAVAQPAKAR